MNFTELLTYDVKEHNWYDIEEPKGNVPNFWKSIWRCFVEVCNCSAIVYVLRNFTHPFYSKSPSLKHVVFVPITANNERVLAPVWHNLAKGEYSILTPEMQEYIPWQLVYFYSLLYILPLIRAYVRLTSQDKILMRANFDYFFLTIGYLKVVDDLLKHNEVRLIVLANDHSTFPRAIIRIAKERGIKTMYLQHCSVSESFPPLEFDYNLLDGEESYLKYREICIPQGETYLIGNPRFDEISRYLRNTKKKIETIGIALNTLDDESTIKRLCVKLRENGYKEITIRPHPRQTLRGEWLSQRNVAFSDPTLENPYAFISKMDVIIAGESGILLDAALMGVMAISFNTRNTVPLDWYSYIKNGLIPYADTFEELIAILHKDPSEWRLRVQKLTHWYNAAFNSPYEGHVGELVADFIKHELSGNMNGFDVKYSFRMNEKFDCCVKEYK